MDLPIFDNLFTQVQIPETGIQIDYTKNLAFFGSCFAQNMAQKFSNLKFNMLANPFGTLYNPRSIEKVITAIATSKTYGEQDAFPDSDKWVSWDTHSSLSRSSRQEFIENLNATVSDSRNFLAKADVAFITLGSAYVYFLKENGEVVANCHKQNAGLFNRRLIDVAEAARSLKNIVQTLKALNPDINVVFTVSPLRHLKDGAHGNNLSKSTLLLAVDQVVSADPATSSYFPSYEIVMDELRDYRFYDSDMVHLTDLAESIIFEHIRAAYFSKETVENARQVEAFMKAAQHRVVNAESSRTRDFAQKHIDRARDLMDKIPGLNLLPEIQYFKLFL